MIRSLYMWLVVRYTGLMLHVKVYLLWNLFNYIQGWLVWLQVQLVRRSFAWESALVWEFVL